MKVFYKHYERPSFEISNGGYFMTDKMKEDYQFQNHYQNELSDFIVPVEDNINYFDEANVIIRINNNYEGLFDFDKAILDINAGVGCYSIRSNFKYSYAFESDKTLFTLLNMNLLMHGRIDHSETYNVILGETNKDVLYDGEQTIIDRHYVPNIDSSKVRIRKSHTIDEYEFNNVGLIKIDIDASNENVLGGALRTIVTNEYPPIIFRLHEKSDKFESTMNFFYTIGYKVMMKYVYENDNVHLATRF